MDKRKTKVRELWTEGIPVKEIIKRTGTLRQTIWRWTRDLTEPETRVKLTKRTPEQAKQRKIARTLYSNGTSLGGIVAQLGVSKPTVYGWIKDLVAKNPNRENNQGRRYKVNDDFFKDPNVINCYWAGLLAGDGNIQNSVIRLALKDRELIDGFKAATAFAGKVREYNAPQGGKMHSVAVSSKQWVRDLQQFNVVPNKSHTLVPPSLEHRSAVCGQLNLAYLKGLYDADGCWTQCHGYPVWKVSGTKMTCEWVKSIANELVPEHMSNVNVNRETTYDFTLRGPKAIKMLKALHEIKTPELSRKWPTDIL